MVLFAFCTCLKIWWNFTKFWFNDRHGPVDNASIVRIRVIIAVKRGAELLSGNADIVNVCYSGKWNRQQRYIRIERTFSARERPDSSAFSCVEWKTSLFCCKALLDEFVMYSIFLFFFSRKVFHHTGREKCVATRGMCMDTRGRVVFETIDSVRWEIGL